MSKVIEVLVSPTGDITIQTKGFSGSECLQASKWLEDALGMTGQRHPTAEMYPPTTTSEEVSQ